MKTGGFSGSRVVGDRNTASAAIPSGAYGGQAIRPGHPACPGDHHSATHRVLHANLVPEHSPALLSSGMAVSYHQLPTVSIGYLIVLFSVQKSTGADAPVRHDSCFAVPAALFGGDCLDLHQAALRQRRNLHAGPCGLVVAEESRIDPVDRCKITHVPDENRGFHHVRPFISRFRQDRADILQCLRCLGFPTFRFPGPVRAGLKSAVGLL